MVPRKSLKFCTPGMRFSAFWGASQSGLIAVYSSPFFCVKKNSYADNVDTGGDPENRSICCCERLRWLTETVNEASQLSIYSAYRVAVVFCRFSWVACRCLESPMSPVFRAVSLVASLIPIIHVADFTFYIYIYYKSGKCESCPLLSLKSNFHVL